MDLIADGQPYPDYPKEAFLFYKLLTDRAGPALSTTAVPSVDGADVTDG